MSYEVKGLEVLRDGAKVADVNPVNGELDFLEGCGNYRVPAVKMLREAGMWDDQNTCIPVAKLDTTRPGTSEPEKNDTAENGAGMSETDAEVERIINETKAIAMEIIEDAKSQAAEIIAKAKKQAGAGAAKPEIAKNIEIVPGKIKSARDLIAVMEPIVGEKCPPMHPRLGDQTPEVIAWFQKHDAVRLEVLKKNTPAVK